VGCVGRLHELLDEPRLTDPGLALHEDESGRSGRGSDERAELVLAADQNRGRETAADAGSQRRGARAGIDAP
jgi:hypothetical protein